MCVCTIDAQLRRVRRHRRIVLHTTRVHAALRPLHPHDAQRAGEVVVLPHVDLRRQQQQLRRGRRRWLRVMIGIVRCGAAAQLRGANDGHVVLQPGEGQRQIAGADDALDAGAIADVQVANERERRDFRRHWSAMFAFVFGADICASGCAEHYVCVCV